MPPAKAHRQVLTHDPPQVGIPAVGNLGREARKVAIGIRLEPLAVPGVNPGVSPGDEAGEVASGTAIAVRGHAAPHDVEQRVGEVVHGHGPVGRRLQTVGGRHPPPHLGGIRGQARRHLLSNRLPGDELAPQPHHRGVVEPGVGDDEPLGRRAGSQRERVLDEIAAELAADVRHGGRWRLAAKAADAPRIQRPHGVMVAERPGHARPQRLGRQGAIADRGVQCRDHEPLVAEQFVTHVGGRQVAVPLVGLLADTRREQLVPAVERPHRHGRPSNILERAVPHDAVDFAGSQLPPQPEAERLVDLLEDDARAELVLVQMPLAAGGG